jgi:Na+/H+-translocating membrane pyrophosphatase
MISIVLFVLTSMIWIYKAIQGDDGLQVMILAPFIGFGLGAATVALFTRIGGGIYAKAADIGCDIVGKIDRNLQEDDCRNPGVITDIVGDHISNIAGTVA